jgi:hypothetical protein
MDRESSYEESLGLVYDANVLHYTGRDLVDGFTFNIFDRLRVIQTCLMTTIGDKIKVLDNVDEGQVKKSFHSNDLFLPCNVIEQSMGMTDEPLVLQQPSSLSEKSTSVIFTVEAETGGLYDIKFQRLASLGDSSKFYVSTHVNRMQAKDEAMSLFQ